MPVKQFFIFLFMVCSGGLYGQEACTTLGQNPSTAFPVCGTAVFNQTFVPLCGIHSITVPGCPDSLAAGGYIDANPFWYQFTCYVSGTFGFVIKPVNPLDDYDWQLYDITGHSPDDVFTNAALVVAGNWSGSSGPTGAALRGASFIQCASDPAENASTFSVMPRLVKDHRYLLLVSHYTDTQDGYSLTFSGGSASITDTTKPRLLNARISCDAASLKVQLSKKIDCKTLSSDGSDFSISAIGDNVISAASGSCSAGFDLNTLNINFDHALPYGDYILTLKNGSDDNTLIDFCGNAIPAGDTLHFSVRPIVPTPLDSITPVGCAPGILTFVFQKPILCSSVADDGSDFIITGPTAVKITSAYGECETDGTSTIINVKLDAPILTRGDYQVKLVRGYDGNTIVDACGEETPAGSTLHFETGDTVSAAFTYRLLYGCKNDTLDFIQPGGHGINSWAWQFDSIRTSSLQNPEVLFPDFNTKTISVTVSNGICSASSAASIILDNTLIADFQVSDSLCPKDNATFVNKSIGHIVEYTWNFGDGTFSTLENPADKVYPVTGTEKDYQVSLIAESNMGCRDTLTKPLKILRNCYIDVPTAFTPNGDGRNDFLYPLDAYKAANLEFRVYNRYGQLVFETKEWTKKWDGKINGKPQDTGTYAWTLSYTDKNSGKKFFLKGTSVLIR